MIIHGPNNNPSNISTEVSGKLIIHKNTDQNVIVVSEDKLRLCLISHREILSSKQGWLAPSSLLLSFIATLATSKFEGRLGLSADTWNAIFVIASLLSGIWSAIEIYKLISNFKKGNIDTVIGYLKNSDQ